MAASCTMSGLKVNGQGVAMTGGEFDYSQLRPLLDAVEAATKFHVEITPPTPPSTTVGLGGKRVGTCAGPSVTIIDTRTEPLVSACSPFSPDPHIPQCVIPL